jgi:hypothetical protein
VPNAANDLRIEKRCVMPDNQPFIKNKEAATLAQAIVDTVREPLLVLDKDLRVLAASRSFYLTFKVARTETLGRLLYALGDGQWDIPRLRSLLENIVPEHGVMDEITRWTITFPRSENARCC